MASSPVELSPWATRFGISRGRAWKDGNKHSMIAPYDPVLHPKYYVAGRPKFSMDPDSGTFNKPTNAELDQLFLSEQSQQRELQGLKTRQLGLLNERLYPGMDSGGHSSGSGTDEALQKFMNTALVIKESDWLECFRKYRWFGIEDLLRDSTRWTNWHPDEGHVWDSLRMPLELANRVLHRLLDERTPWLDAVMFGEIQKAEAPMPEDYSDGAKVVPFPDGEGIDWDVPNLGLKLRHDPPGEDNRPSVAEFHKRFDELTRFIIWTFMDEYDYRRSEQGSVKGMQAESHEPVFDEQAQHSTILVSVRALRGLNDEKLTLAERCMDWLDLAATIMHELMHAVWARRAYLEGQVYNDDNGSHEPYFEGDYHRELGISFIQWVFGGNLRALEIDDFRWTGEWFADAPLGIILYEFPNPADATTYQGLQDRDITIIPGHNYYVDEVPLYRYHVPVYWVSALFNEAFWTTIVPRSGSQAFKCPKLLCSAETVIGSMLSMDPQRKRFSLRRYGENVPVAELKSGLERICDDVLRNELEWERQRPWYAKEMEIWQKSPWGWNYGRKLIDTFRYYHIRREAANCHYTAVDLLVIARDLILTDADRYGTIWIFEVIAWLMLGCMPFFTEKKVYADRSHHRNMRATQDGVNRMPRWPTMPLSYTWWTTPRDALGQIRGLDGREVTHPNQYLEIASQRFTELCGHPTERRWYNAFNHALQPLLAERPGQPVDSWGTFRFTEPNYAPPPEWVAFDQNQQYKQVAYTGDVAVDGFMPSPIFDAAAKLQLTASKRAGRRRRPAPLKHAPTRYFTIAEVADRRWVVEPDEIVGWDVYDISRLLLAVDADFHDLTTCTEQGFQLLSSTADVGGKATSIRNSLADLTAKGKLLQRMQLAEVAECDGTGKMPVWVTYMDSIFDITAFPFANTTQRVIMCKNPGGPLEFDKEHSSETKAHLIGRLMPYRCGLLRSEHRHVSEFYDLQTYTPTSLRYHDNPSLGCYTAIGCFVYNLTEYCDSHPGGSNILRDVAGRDATSVFLRNTDCHSLEMLDDQSYAHLRVGRMIDEVKSGDVQDREISLHNYVFDISDLDNKDPALHNLLAPLVGTDATAFLTSHKKDDEQIARGLVSLYTNYRQLVVAEINPTIHLRSISREELAQHDGRNNTRTWVAVDDDVYDVTLEILTLIDGQYF
ncbi:hypothetical protein TruAng_002767 [Truncatella angustata]|nr:hypothetical protein TruAng_002767 [Truncatella angustata]